MAWSGVMRWLYEFKEISSVSVCLIHSAKTFQTVQSRHTNLSLTCSLSLTMRCHSRTNIITANTTIITNTTPKKVKRHSSGYKVKLDIMVMVSKKEEEKTYMLEPDLPR